MNQKLRITILVLGMMTLMSSICFARDRSTDSLVITRMWDYYETSCKSVKGVEKNMYFGYSFGSKRRNVLLFLVPTMYSIAKGDKQYAGESYCKVKFRGITDFDLKRQVSFSTIPHHRNVMPAIFDLITPNLCSTQLYNDRLLSPFHRTNRFFYKYRVVPIGNTAQIYFRPRSSNTQLIKGKALVDINTGRVLSFSFKGEFDMLNFKVDATMDNENIHSPLPDHCTTETSFKFLGNDIEAKMTAYYNCPVSLPDSVNEEQNLNMMGGLRPIFIGREEQDIYDAYNLQREQAKESDTLPKKKNRLREVAWDIIGDNLINSMHTHSENVSLNMSPLLNPLYMGYSHSKGVSYKLNIGARYAWNTHRYLTLNPQMGYSFKLKQFYYTLPLRMTYNPKRNGYAEISWGNGNHTTHGALYEAYQKTMGAKEIMPDFKDEQIRLVNNVKAFDWIEIMTGLVYHHRKSCDPQKMQKAGLADDFRSFAPSLTFRLTPWKKGPTLTANYERSFKKVLKSNLAYERWEFDAVYKHQNKSVRILNMRLGTGFYTQRSSDYFVDYTNFRDNNLPSGWEDDWTGQFQLLNSRWYNDSQYYVRGHVSYDSPLMVLSWIPWLGRIIETERFYLSAMSIEHTHPYFELGYGFKNRYFSTGIFASFLNTKYQSFGCKFTIELFRRW